MEIRNLLTFIKVAEGRSLSNAAKQLGYAQSTVTMQMQQLEQELGIPLYERVGKQIQITQAGQELLTYAAQIVKTSQEALQIGKGKSREIDGTLRIGVADEVEELWLAERLCEYANAFPRVHISVRSGRGQDLTQMLLHNEIDLIMIVDHWVTDPVFVHACDTEEEVHFVAAPEHPLAGSKKLSLENILSYRLIRGDLAAPYERDLELAISAIGNQNQDGMEIDNRNLALKLVLSQNGVTLVPDRAVQHYLQENRLAILDYTLPGAGLWQQTLYHKNKWLTDAMNAWIKMLGENS